MTPNDVKIVADNIDDFIEVPDGLVRLRKAVLTLAVSGKLVAQDPKDGTADALLEKIQAERTKTENGTGGRKTKAKQSTPAVVDEHPFNIPKSWKWVRLGAVTNYGRTEKTKGRKVEDGMWILELEDLEKDGGRLLSVVEYPQRKPQSDKNIFKKGDVLYGKLRPYLNKVIVAGRDGISSSELLPVRWYGQGKPEYLRFVMLSEYFSEHVNQRVYGMKMPRLGTEDGQDTPIPLPPLAEQVRIVKKVEELMNQIDDLETKKQERDEVRTRLARSALESLGRGESKIAFEELTELVKTPSDIKELENALLTLAISGKLVPQDKKESANIDSNELKRVCGCKKKAKVFSEILPEEMLFEIPVNWKWVRLGSAFTDYGSGSTPSRGNDGFYKNGNTNWYKSGELNDGVLSTDAEEKITDLALEKCHLRMNKPGDLLIAMYGATAGRVAILDNEGTTNQAVWGGTPDNTVDLKYLFYYILQSRRQLLKTSSGAAQPNISGEKISAHTLPLPPLLEQKRIVKKIEGVMVLINRMKQVVGEK